MILPEQIDFYMRWNPKAKALVGTLKSLYNIAFDKNVFFL